MRVHVHQRLDGDDAVTIDDDALLQQHVDELRPAADLQTNRLDDLQDEAATQRRVLSNTDRPASTQPAAHTAAHINDK